MKETIIQYNAINKIINFILKTNTSKIFVLVDHNTKEHCLPIVLRSIKADVIEIEIQAGEKHKNIKTAEFIWQQLTSLGADRNSLLLNLGGGVITDMGGFAAATFKRGIKFINIPTTVLGMVDAAIGGKTGIDYKGLKNQIGLFTHPEMIVVYPDFIITLPKRELKSGLAEIIKYGLIDSDNIWKYIQELDVDTIQIDENIIRESIEIKEKIVAEDPKEKGIRKTLNFGHTLGHAIETHFLTKAKEEQLLHGEAIAIGMILAAHLSFQTQGLTIDVLENISSNITRLYKDSIPSHFNTEDLKSILDLLKHDKKNTNGIVNFVLLTEIGKPVLDCQVSENEILKAFLFMKI